MEQKRIMILGVGEAQLNLIAESKKLGYYIVVCDMRAESEGAKLADSFYAVNYMDRDAILDAAKKEHIDGVISNSEAAMLNVAWLSEQLGLPGNPEESIDILLSKTKFRDLQESVGVYAPKHEIVDSSVRLFEAIKKIGYPLVIKPVLCSGTRGTTVINTPDDSAAEEAFRVCADFSRNGLVSVEEYVRMDSLVAYDAEIFVYGNKILWDGFYGSYRTADAPMLPMMESLPPHLTESQVDAIKCSIAKLIHAAGIRLGEYNAETYFTTNGEVFVIEINPRQGGNHIPDLVHEHSGISFTQLLCSTAVGETKYIEETIMKPRENHYVTMYVVFSMVDGIYRGLEISDEIQPYIQWHENSASIGQLVHRKMNAGDAVAFVNLQFDSYETQHRFTDDIEKYIRAVVTEETVQP